MARADHCPLPAVPFEQESAEEAEPIANSFFNAETQRDLFATDGALMHTDYNLLRTARCLRIHSPQRRGGRREESLPRMAPMARMRGHVYNRCGPKEMRR
jgi:hypothetical protein